MKHHLTAGEPKAQNFLSVSVKVHKDSILNSFFFIEVVPTSEDVDEILWCEHSVKSLPQHIRVLIFLFNY